MSRVVAFLIRLGYATGLRWWFNRLQQWRAGEDTAKRSPLPRFQTPHQMVTYARAKFTYRKDKQAGRFGALDWSTPPEVFQARLEAPSSGEVRSFTVAQHVYRVVTLLALGAGAVTAYLGGVSVYIVSIVTLIGLGLFVLLLNGRPKDGDGDCDDYHAWCAEVLTRMPEVTDVVRVSCWTWTRGHTACLFRRSGVLHLIDYDLFEVESYEDALSTIHDRHHWVGPLVGWVFETVDLEDVAIYPELP